MTESRAQDRTTRAFLALFFCSGLTSLVYETVFIKQLSYLFGGTAYATSTVLASFMGGMAIGSLVFGRLADRVRRPILLYGAMELAIGVYCLFQPALLDAVEPLYVAAFREGTVTLAGATGLRALISALVLITPSILMGGTLPVVVRHFVRNPQDLGVGIGRIYATNTVGAATGVLLGSYVFLHAFGLGGTVHLMTALNVLIFLGAVWLSRQSTEGAGSAQAQEVTAAVSGAKSSGPRRLRIVLLSGALLSGFVTFHYEVVWVHVLATVVGTSVYAFGLMLFTFLCGLSLGGVLAGRRCTSEEASWRVLVRSQLGAGVAVVCILPLWDKAPWVFTAVGSIVDPGFIVGELTRFVVCFLLMIVPTTLLGMTFPAIVYLHGRRFEGLGMRVGQVVASNTVGAIAGSLLSGFLILPALGSQNCNILGAALSCAGAAVFLFAGGAAAGSRPRVLGLAGATVVAAFLLPTWNVKWLTQGSNVYFGGSRSGESVEFFAEDIHSGIVTVSRAPVRVDCANGQCPFAQGSACDSHNRCTAQCDTVGAGVCPSGGLCQEGVCRGLVLRTNGKFQGNDSDERKPQAQFAHLPMLLTPAERPRVLVVGLGTGMTPGIFMDYDIERMDIAELSPGIVEATPLFDHINHGLGSKRPPNVAVELVDGRNFLLLEDRTYDVISMELSSIWFAGASSLFSRDFYEIARARLAPGGILSNWIQLHHISPEVLRVVVNSAREVFPHVSFWLSGSQGVVVASNEPFHIDAARLDRRMRDPAFRRAIAEEIDGGHLYQLLGNFVFGSEGADRLHEELLRSGAPSVSTDDNLYLEYATPKGNVREKDVSGGYLALAAYGPADDRGVLGLLQGLDPRMASFVEGAMLTQKARLPLQFELDPALGLARAARAEALLARARSEAPEDAQVFVTQMEALLRSHKSQLAGAKPTP